VDNQAAEEQAKELQELRAKNSPWFQVVIPNLGQVAALVQQPAWELFQQYLHALCEADRNLLERGAYDKFGHDLGDVYRGKIRTFKELIYFKDAVLSAKKQLEEQEEQQKKKPINIDRGA